MYVQYGFLYLALTRPKFAVQYWLAIQVQFAIVLFIYYTIIYVRDTQINPALTYKLLFM
jgi:hypothetical protein